MAGRRKSTPPQVMGNALVASAVRYPGKIARIYAPVKEWQKEAYRHYEICGEARYAANYFGHSLSRAVLHVENKPGHGATRLTEGKPVEVLEELFNGTEGQAAMLAAIGKHLTIAGECYLIGRNIEVFDEGGKLISSDDVWEVMSCLEVKVAGTKWKVTPLEEGRPDVTLKDDDVVIRIWRPHPAKRGEADSPFRSLLPILREIEWLTMHIFAQCSSRLAGAGMMFISQGVEFPPPRDDAGKEMAFANQAEGFMLWLANMMTRAIEDPSSPERLVPGVAMVPEEVMKSGDVAKLMHFWTELDAKSLEMRQAAVHRFALGMDLDPSKVEGVSTGASTGGGNSNGPNHWGMWQVQEETITLHIEPMLDLVCNAITIGYLRPAMDASDAWATVRYDTKKLRLRPDRSKESIELFNLGLLKAEVVLRENGFDPGSDMPDAEEIKSFLIWKMATQSSTPEQVAAAAAMLGVDVPSGADQEPREERPDPSLEGHPVRELPERPAASLLPVAEAIALHGLQRIGNRLRSSVANPPVCPATSVHTLIRANGSTTAVMKDAFPTAEQVLEGVADASKVMPVIESYCETLLTEQAPHSRDRLARFLQEAGL